MGRRLDIVDDDVSQNSERRVARLANVGAGESEKKSGRGRLECWTCEAISALRLEVLDEWGIGTGAISSTSYARGKRRWRTAREE